MTRQTGSFNAAFVSREFQTTFLLCDCNLLWLLRWIKERSIAVKSTKCSYPQSLQGQLFTYRPELFTCGMAWARPSLCRLFNSLSGGKPQCVATSG